MLRLGTIVLLAGVLAITVAIFALQYWPGGGGVSAATVAQRAQEARQGIAAGIGPDTTLHAVQSSYRAQERPAGPFGLPARTHGEYWLYFGADGEAAGYRSTSYDSATGQLVQTGALVDGQYVITDVASGATRVLDFDISADSLVEQLAAAQLDTATLVAPDAAADSVKVAGKDAYVVEMEEGDAVRRSYIDADTYREVKWERVEGDTITESRETPVFEVLQGYSTGDAP